MPKQIKKQNIQIQNINKEQNNYPQNQQLHVILLKYLTYRNFLQPKHIKIIPSSFSLKNQNQNQQLRILYLQFFTDVIIDNKNITYHYTEMTSSTETKLKSKYDSSSKKIKQLYEQFSVMRRNICTPSKRNRNDESFTNMGEKFQRQSIKNSIQISIPRQPKTRQLFKSDTLSSLNFQTQVFLKNAMLKNLTTCFVELDKRLDERTLLMESRLQNLSHLFIQVSKFYKIRLNNLKKKHPSCRCSQFQQILKQVQGKYQKKISEMVWTYENKISLLVKQHQDTSDSSNSKQIPKQFKQQLQKLQDKLLLKQQEITGIKIQSSRLRRALDQHKLLVTQKQSLIEELTRELTDKQNKITQLNNLKVNKKNSSQLKICRQCPNIKQEMLGLKKVIQDIEKQKLELHNVVGSLRKQLEQMKSQQNQKQNQNKLQNSKVESKKKQSEWNESQIQDKQIVVSDYESQQQIVSRIKETCMLQDIQPLRHTQYFNTNKRKGSYKYQLKIKQLQSQIQLLSQQNKLLKNKKDKFEQQCKQNESDEQKFQMQSQILREQLKNLNINIKILDQCAILCLKDKKIPQENIQKLNDMIKFKEQFYKKYPKKKIQRSLSKS